MKRFKSISVSEDTFDAINNLAETVLPKVRLLKAQVVENLVKGSHGNINHNQENNNDKSTTTKAS